MEDEILLAKTTADAVTTLLDCMKACAKASLDVEHDEDFDTRKKKERNIRLSSGVQVSLSLAQCWNVVDMTHVHAVLEIAPVEQRLKVVNSSLT